MAGGLRAVSGRRGRTTGFSRWGSCMGKTARLRLPMAEVLARAVSSGPRR